VSGNGERETREFGEENEGLIFVYAFAFGVFLIRFD
jgi:hypothetical protein